LKVEFTPESGSSLYPFHLAGQSGKTKFKASQMRICFISTDGGYKSVSIDYYSQDVAHLA
jgi:hypothetical protein